MKKLILIAALLFLFSCTPKHGKTVYFTQPNSEISPTTAEMASCELEVQRIMVNYRIHSTMFTYGWEVSKANDYAQNIYENCMLSKGFVRKSWEW